MKRRPNSLYLASIVLAFPIFSACMALAAELPKECASANREHLPQPKIFVYKISKSGGTPRPIYRVSGTIEGSCLNEVGYFQRGHLARAIPIRVTRDFTRTDFRVEVDLSDFPEIRAYNSAGDSDIYPIYIGSATNQYNAPLVQPNSKYGTKRDDYYATGPVDTKTRRKQIFGW